VLELELAALSGDRFNEITPAFPGALCPADVTLADEDLRPAFPDESIRFAADATVVFTGGRLILNFFFFPPAVEFGLIA
jgi:hypothetical protein